MPELVKVICGNDLKWKKGKPLEFFSLTMYIQGCIIKEINLYLYIFQQTGGITRTSRNALNRAASAFRHGKWPAYMRYYINIYLYKYIYTYIYLICNLIIKNVINIYFMYFYYIIESVKDLFCTIERWFWHLYWILFNFFVI